MGEIILNKNEHYFLDSKFFIIKSGRIATKEILETGKVITNEVHLSSGEIVGNFFKFLKISDFKIPEMEIEVKSLEDETVLEELVITEEKIKKDTYLKQLITVLLKKVLLKLIYHLYDTKGYILAVLKLQKNERDYIYKEDVHYENFNISKSQFYLAYKTLKKEKYILEINGKIFFNIKKVDNYLNLLGEDDL